MGEVPCSIGRHVSFRPPQSSVRSSTHCKLDKGISKATMNRVKMRKHCEPCCSFYCSKFPSITLLPVNSVRQQPNPFDVSSIDRFGRHVGRATPSEHNSSPNTQNALFAADRSMPSWDDEHQTSTAASIASRLPIFERRSGGWIFDNRLRVSMLDGSLLPEIERQNESRLGGGWVG